VDEAMPPFGPGHVFFFFSVSLGNYARGRVVGPRGAFAVHGVFDVSGHRIGALWAGTLAPEQRNPSAASFELASDIAPIFPRLGVILIAVALCVRIHLGGVLRFPPTTANVAAGWKKKNPKKRWRRHTLQED